jgi:hypothetical protein
MTARPHLKVRPKCILRQHPLTAGHQSSIIAAAPFLAPREHFFCEEAGLSVRP